MLRNSLALTLAACAAAALVAAAASQTTPPRAVAAREEAYRANNIGVTRLEQFDFEAAAASFRRALEIDPRLASARLNLGIALFYGGDADGAGARDCRRQAGPRRPAASRLSARPHRARDREDRGGDRGIHTRRAPGSGRRRHRDQSRTAVPPGAQVSGSDRRLSPRDGRGAVQRHGRVRPREHAHPRRPRRRRARRDGAFSASQRGHLRHHLLTGLPLAGPLRRGHHLDRSRGTTRRHASSRHRVRRCDGDAAIASRGPAAADGGSVTAFDLDGDGKLDLVESSATGVRLFRNASGRFADVTADMLGEAAGGSTTAVLAGDYDNDSHADFAVLRPAGIRLLRRNPAAGFTDVTAGAELGALSDPRSAAWLDADHDGDLDLFVARGPGGAGAPTWTLAAQQRHGPLYRHHDATPGSRSPRRSSRSSRPTTTTAATSICCWSRRRLPSSSATCATARSATSPPTSG